MRAGRMGLGRSLTCIADRQSGLLPKLVLCAGFLYLFIPLDLIPDRIPWIGHLDEVSFVLSGILLSRFLALRVFHNAGLDDPALRSGLRNLQQVRAWLGRTGRRFAHRALAGGIDRAVVRLMIGRRATSLEMAQFRSGLQSSTHGLPPLLRAAAYVPAASTLLSRTMVLSRRRCAVAGSDPAVGLTDIQLMGDPLRIWTGPKLRFLHFEKTAGSSFTTFITSLFHPLQIDPDPHRNYPPHERTPFPPRSAASQKAASLVWGHYDLPSMLLLDEGDPSFRVTFVREPRARVLSFYYYWLSNTVDQASIVQAARGNSLLGFLRLEDPDIRNYIENLYVRRLTGLYASASGDALREQPDQALADALAALETFDFVGLADKLQEGLTVLGHQLGFAPPQHTPRVNVLARSERNPILPYRPTPREPITPEIERELARLTHLDQAIYESARSRFELASASFLIKQPGS